MGLFVLSVMILLDVGEFKPEMVCVCFWCFEQAYLVRKWPDYYSIKEHTQAQSLHQQKHALSGWEKAREWEE